MSGEREEEWYQLFKETPPVYSIAEQHPSQTHQNHTQHYYQQYKKIYLTSYKLSTQLQKLNRLRESIIEKLNQIESKGSERDNSIRKQNHIRCKRSRRTAQEIERKYTCQMEYCGKCYGSDGSLQQHIKLKHPEIYIPRNPESF